MFFVCVYFFSQILHNHRGGMFFKFFFEIFSAAHFFCLQVFFLRKKDAEPLHRISFFVFFIMTMKTSSIILCFFLMIEPLTLNCAYFRKKRFFVMFFGRWRGQDIFVRGGKFCFGKTFFGRDFCFFLYIKLSSLLLRKEKKRFS